MEETKCLTFSRPTGPRGDGHGIVHSGCSETCLRSSTTASSGTSCFSRSSRPSRPENGRVWVLSGDQAGGLRKRLNQLVDEVDDFLEVSRARRGTPWRLVRAAEKIPRRAL